MSAVFFAVDATCSHATTLSRLCVCGCVYCVWLFVAVWRSRRLRAEVPELTQAQSPQPQALHLTRARPSAMAAVVAIYIWLTRVAVRARHGAVRWAPAVCIRRSLVGMPVCLRHGAESRFDRRGRDTSAYFFCFGAAWSRAQRALRCLIGPGGVGFRSLHTEAAAAPKQIISVHNNTSYISNPTTRLASTSQ
jgi:hypothetical protein